VKIAEKYKLWFAISLVVIVVGLGSALFTGLNLGIDFTGGTMMQINMGEVVEVKDIRSEIEAFNLHADIIHAGTEKHEIIIKTKASLSNAERMEIFAQLQSAYGLENDAFVGAEQFGPAIGDEIQNRALIAVLLASVGMFIYIIFRFEMIYGISSIIALMHDVLILISIYALFRVPVNSSFIAAILTIVGYSINDTIVVFDRVRENVKRMEKATYNEIANTSLKQTITRSINTSLTTLVVIGSLYVLGVESIKEFAFPLMAGVIVGTYSSIFIASPVWALFKNAQKKKNRSYPAQDEA
jgi:preprotein translocase SecF subunit